MMQSHDFDPSASAWLAGDVSPDSDGKDAARGPRGIVLGLAIGTLLWIAAIAACLL